MTWFQKLLGRKLPHGDAVEARDAPPRSAPDTPLEILVRDGAVLDGPPRLAGKAISCLVAADADVVTIDYFQAEKRLNSSNADLRQFLAMIAGAGRAQEFFNECMEIMYEPRLDGSLGTLACLQQGLLYSFSVFATSTGKSLRWEFHRSTRPVET